MFIFAKKQIMSRYFDNNGMNLEKIRITLQETAALFRFPAYLSPYECQEAAEQIEHARHEVQQWSKLNDITHTYTLLSTTNSPSLDILILISNLEDTIKVIEKNIFDFLAICTLDNNRKEDFASKICNQIKEIQELFERAFPKKEITIPPRLFRPEFNLN